MSNMRDSVAGVPEREAPPEEKASLDDRSIPFNIMDRFIALLDRAMRDAGGIGFETQVLLQLSGRLDKARLSRAVSRLSSHYPLFTARPIDDHWDWSRPRDIVITESAGLVQPGEFSSHMAARLCRGKSDQQDPALGFHILRGADGRDALILQYNHVLMDIHAVIPLVLALKDADLGELRAPQTLARNPFAARLSAWSAARRASFAVRALWGWLSLNLGSTHHFASTRREASVGVVAIHGRTIPSDAWTRIESALRKENDLPSVSMSLLACAFLAIGKRGGKPVSSKMTIALGLDLNLRPRKQLILQNLMSIVPMTVRPSHLQSFVALRKTLASQLRDHLSRGRDWGFVQLGLLMARAEMLASCLTRLLVRRGLTFWYAYVGSFDELAIDIFDARIEDVRLASPGAPPAGASLLAHKFRGNLHVQLIRFPGCLSHEDAESFLEDTVEPLLGLP